MALFWGIGFAFLFHALLAILLFSAATAGRGRALSGGESLSSVARRRPAFAEHISLKRRGTEGAVFRSHSFLHSRAIRRSIQGARGPRKMAQWEARGFRFIQIAAGRRGVASVRYRKARGIDFGPAADGNILQAMLIPRLGLKGFNPKELPKLTKYEQPERVEAGVNVSRDNPNPKEIKFKAAEHKKAQFDRRRKKPPTLSELIDAPDDEDPRKRATSLDGIIGSPEGSAWGEGTEGKAGNLYLAQMERSFRAEFRVPVFLSKEELKKLVVEIEIDQMDAAGRVVSYRLRRESPNSAFNSAALEAVKRFVSAEGGNKTLPPPDPDMLQYINQRGILVRLEGKKLQ